MEMESRRLSVVFKIALALAFAIGFYVAIDQGWLVGWIDRASIEARLRQYGLWRAAFMFTLVYIGLTTIGVPATALTLVGGALFGVALGFALVMIGATVGAIGAFMLARFVARDFLRTRLKGRAWFVGLMANIEREGFWYLLTIRLIPLFPFNGVNFVAGLTSIKQVDYLLATLIGIAPGSLIYVYASSSALDAFEGGMGQGFVLALLALGLLSALPIMWRILKARQEMRDTDRLPKGQRLTEKFPILHVGDVPTFDRATWRFRIFGLVEEGIDLSYDQFTALPNTRVKADFHCVTGWSRFDNHWGGVLAKDLMKLVRPKAEAKFALIHCEGEYTTNIALDELLDEDVLFAFEHDGAPITPDHGFPLRLVVPKLYAWKSAKWARGVELIPENRRGFWERHGYHIHGDPWKEERYSSQE